MTAASAGVLGRSDNPPDRLGRFFAGSVVTHAAIAGLFLVSGFLPHSETWGEQHSSSGSVGVGIVKTIPIPRREGPTNPLANDSKSTTPQEPAPVKSKPEVKAPERDAIQI